MDWCSPEFLSSFKLEIFTVVLPFQAGVILKRTATRAEVCDNLLTSSGHKIRNILLRCQPEEEDEIFEPDIRIEHLTLGDSSDKD